MVVGQQNLPIVALTEPSECTDFWKEEADIVLCMQLAYGTVSTVSTLHLALCATGVYTRVKYTILAQPLQSMSIITL